MTAYASKRWRAPDRRAGCLLLAILALCAGGLWAGAGPSAATAEVNGARADGALHFEITVQGSLQNPAWSPGGETLLFTRWQGGYNAGPADLVTFRLVDGAVATLVSDGSDNVNLPGSAWNAATGQIAFSSSRDPHDEIYLIGAGASPGSEVKITDRGARMAYEPSVSPDGQWIVFESHPVDVAGQGVIEKVSVGTPRQYVALTASGDDCRQPNWSPTGDLVVYQKLSGEHWHLWLTDPAGSTATALTSGPGDETDASFSPNGQWVVYSADAPGTEVANLFAIPIQGGSPLRITTYSGYDGAPSFSPDGREIAFETSPGDPDGSAGTELAWIDVSGLPVNFAPEPGKPWLELAVVCALAVLARRAKGGRMAYGRARARACRRPGDRRSEAPRLSPLPSLCPSPCRPGPATAR